MLSFICTCIVILIVIHGIWLIIQNGVFDLRGQEPPCENSFAEEIYNLCHKYEEMAVNKSSWEEIKKLDRGVVKAFLFETMQKAEAINGLDLQITAEIIQPLIRNFDKYNPELYKVLNGLVYKIFKELENYHDAYLKISVKCNIFLEFNLKSSPFDDSSKEFIFDEFKSISANDNEIITSSVIKNGCFIQKLIIL